MMFVSLFSTQEQDALQCLLEGLRCMLCLADGLVVSFASLAVESGRWTAMSASLRDCFRDRGVKRSFLSSSIKKLSFSPESCLSFQSSAVLLNTLSILLPFPSYLSLCNHYARVFTLIMPPPPPDYGLVWANVQSEPLKRYYSPYAGDQVKNVFGEAWTFYYTMGDLTSPDTIVQYV